MAADSTVARRFESDWSARPYRCDTARLRSGPMLDGQRGRLRARCPSGARPLDADRQRHRRVDHARDAEIRADLAGQADWAISRPATSLRSVTSVHRSRPLLNRVGVP